MKKNKYKIESVKTAVVQEDSIPSDVLDRIADYEIMSNRGVLNSTAKNQKVFKVSVLKNILKNKEDDTNETTKSHIEYLYLQLRGFRLFIVESI